MRKTLRKTGDASMSEKYDFILVYIEKILGIIIALIGAALTYNTYNNPQAAGWAYGYFIAIGIFLVFSGLLMTIAKTK